MHPIKPREIIGRRLLFLFAMPANHSPFLQRIVERGREREK